MYFFQTWSSSVKTNELIEYLRVKNSYSVSNERILRKDDEIFENYFCDWNLKLWKKILSFFVHSVNHSGNHAEVDIFKLLIGEAYTLNIFEVILRFISPFTM